MGGGGSRKIKPIQRGDCLKGERGGVFEGGGGVDAPKHTTAVF